MVEQQQQTKTTAAAAATANELNNNSGSAENMFYTDPDGVVLHRRALYENQYTDE